ncbi:HTH-type transcriptional regulator Hpr [Priestia megaterium]|jgi:MarR family transcriptional regulator, protease production regulatory protein HPr|uniref:HTH-type transcriptional regulator Hpr n=1 Tax=Priestia megaterium TaxID=1404 RepID=UPI001A949763|nr:HTH-type transcriptional regulator Hpr [Priestia megaterium]QSX23702.1 HTH-type transcriptional regulator Hpr [Priestia megaterium]
MIKISDDYTFKDASLYSLKLMQLSKLLWRAVEKDWEQWVKPYGLNINEHHILCIANNLPNVCITELAEVGAMHITTAFNFSKRLEQKGYLQIFKNKLKKKNTYIKLTEKGEKLLINILRNYNPYEKSLYIGSLPLRELNGKFPDFTELLILIRNIYGEDFITLINNSLINIEKVLIEQDKNIQKEN